MTSDESQPAPQNLVQLKLARDRTLETLHVAFATDVIDDSELERRIEAAQAASTEAELSALVRDLEGVEALLPPGSALVPASGGASTAVSTAGGGAAPTTALVPVGDAPEAGRITSIFSNNQRKGRFTLPRRLRVLSVFANVEIDLRDAQLAAGENVVRATSVLGNVEVIVPPDLPVVMDGSGLLGNFEHDGDARDVGDAAAYVRVRGVAVLGNVEVSERLPGESARQAHKRRKRERKALAAAAADERLALTRGRAAQQPALPPAEQPALPPAEQPALPPHGDGDDER